MGFALGLETQEVVNVVKVDDDLSKSAVDQRGQRVPVARPTSQAACLKSSQSEAGWRCAGQIGRAGIITHAS